MSVHSFNLFVAQKYGTHPAILITHFISLTKINIGLKENYYNDRYWFSVSINYLMVYFPYFSKQKLYKLLRDLIKSDVLIKRLDDSVSPPKVWYSLCDDLSTQFNLH